MNKSTEKVMQIAGCANCTDYNKSRCQLQYGMKGCEKTKMLLDFRKYILQKAYDMLDEKRKAIRTEDGWDAWVKMEDVDIILNELNGTPHHYMEDGENQITHKLEIV